MERIGKIARWLSVTLGIVLLTSFTVDATRDGAISQSALAILAGSVSGAKGCPEGMVALSGEARSVCVDIYEASPGVMCANTDIKNAGQTRNDLEQSACVPESKKDATPWTFVTLNQAQELCARAGKRLLSNEEWYRAALGTPDTPGSDTCNIRGGGAAKTGARAGCASAALTIDMIGNVWEWVDGQIADGSYDGRTLPSSGYVTEADQGGIVVKTDTSPNPDYYDDYFWVEASGVYGMLRGGFYGSGDDAGTFSLQGKTPPSFSGAAVGFRCALDLPS